MKPAGRPRILLLLLLLAFHVPLSAQQNKDHLWQQMMEQWAEQNDSEEVPDGLLEQLQGYIENPINLNDTTSDALSNLPFLTDFQRDVIKAYIAQNGEMVTLSELHLLNGFDTITLRLMEPFVTVAPTESDSKPTLRQMLRSGHSNLRMGGRRQWPLSRGYNEELFAGNPLRLYFRYQFKYADRIALQVSGEKDPGEALFGNASPQGFDYYGYYLMFQEFGRLKKAIVGKYQLQFGQGATLWSGYAPWMSGSMPLWRYGQGLRTSSAFGEYGSLRGAAATLQLHRRWDLTLFYSNASRDATTNHDADTLDAGESQVQSLYQSGYHRTDNELSKKGLLTEQLFGGHLQYRYQHLVIGATAYGITLSDAIVSPDYVYNTFAFSGRRNFNAGIDIAYRHRRLLLFGEIAAASNDSLTSCWRTLSTLPVAAVGGLQFHIDANNNLSIAYHYGAPTYHNLHANTLGQSSSPQNEEGLLLYFRTRLPRYIYLQTSIDLFRYPWMRYRVYSPSNGADYRLTLSKDIAPHTTLACQYRYRTAERNSDGQTYGVERTRRQQLQLSVDYTPDQSLRLHTRIVYSWFDCEDHAPLQGFLALQDVSYRWHRIRRPLTLSTRLALFDIDAYDARIYTYESDLMYEFAVPMLTDKGVRCYLLLRHELSPNLSLALKYAYTLYPERETIGSGYDRIDANYRHEFKAQLRLRF